MTYIHMPSIKRVLRISPYSNRGIAERLEVSESTVSRWKRGEATPAWDYIERLYLLHIDYVRSLNDGLGDMRRQMKGLRMAEGLDDEEPEAYRAAS